MAYEKKIGLRLGVRCSLSGVVRLSGYESERMLGIHALNISPDDFAWEVESL